VTTAQEKLVVRVSLGPAAVASGTDLPEPVTEQQWHWRRITGALLTLCAAALLLYGWLNVESPDTAVNTIPENAPVVSTAESIEAATPELVLAAVQQNAEPVVSGDLKFESEVEGVTETAVSEPRGEAQPAVEQSAEDADAQQEDGAPLFHADTGVLRLALLTNQNPSAKAFSFGEQIDAATVPHLALYSEVTGLNGQHIEHRWYYEGKLMTKITLPVKLDYWRTYSRKEFDANQKGEWRVEILDPQQNLLFSHHFHYQ
jgi:hypothetical protein